MSDNSAVDVERRPPEATFSLLGNETRVAILHALVGAEEPVSFSTLRERVGVSDSGKFNYHLGKLADSFVRRTAEGYELTLAGGQIVGALLAGTYTASASFDPIEIESPCPMCEEAPLVATYEDEQFHIVCRACEDWHNRFGVPPGLLDQFSREELPRMADQWMRSVFGRAIAGFCDTCAGRMDGELFVDETKREPARARFRCERCGERIEASPGLAAMSHPAVLGFYYDHGENLHELASWEFLRAHDDQDVSVVSEDPLTVEVRITIDAEELAVTVGPDAQVSAVDRHEI